MGKKKVPFVAFSADEIKAGREMKAGDAIACDICSGEHIIKDSDPGGLLWYKCGESAYLAGIDGHSIVGRR